MPSRPPGTLRRLLRPSMFVLHVPAVLATSAAVWLGTWQLDSWQEHRQDRSAEIAEAEPVPLADVLGPDDPFPGDGLGRPVVLGGTWVPGSAVYVADKEHHGRTGYWTVALVETCGTEATRCDAPAALPVVRGWSPERLDVDEPTGTARLTGWLQPGDSAADVPDADPTDDVLPSLRIPALLQRAGGDLYGGYLILDEPAALRGGLTAVTPDSLPDPPTFTALRNFLYGLEWYLFAGFAVFLWWRWTRDELHRQRAVEGGGDGDETGPAPESEEPVVTPVSVAAGDERSADDARLPSSS